jgi:hypothetical protein
VVALCSRRSWPVPGPQPGWWQLKRLQVVDTLWACLRGLVGTPSLLHYPCPFMGPTPPRKPPIMSDEKSSLIFKSLPFSYPPPSTIHKSSISLPSQSSISHGFIPAPHSSHLPTHPPSIHSSIHLCPRPSTNPSIHPCIHPSSSHYHSESYTFTCLPTHSPISTSTPPHTPCIRELLTTHFLHLRPV